MLYITTRNKIDSFTSHRVLREGFAPNGGLFLPIKFSLYTPEQIAQFKNKSFCEILAHVLNDFFSTGLTGWDLEFAIGRDHVDFARLGRKLIVAQLWKNTNSSYKACANRIYALLCKEDYTGKGVTGWASLAIRIAYMFATYILIPNEDGSTVDFAVSGGDLETVIALWFAKRMGLPVGKIIFGCNENSGLWDLLYKGQMDTSQVAGSTDTPDMNRVNPLGLEYLIYSVLGLDENIAYTNSVANKATYHVPKVHLSDLNDGLFCSVVGENRCKDIIKSVYATNQYLIDPYTAIAFSALQDYRAKSGENRFTVLLADEKPACYSGLISEATGLPIEQIEKA